MIEVVASSKPRFTLEEMKEIEMHIELKPVEDQVVVLMGASSGIGRGAAKLFAAPRCQGGCLGAR